MVTCGCFVKKMLECLKQAFGVERTTLFIIMPLVALVLCFPALAEEKRPNIVIMLADNVGWGDIGIYGGGILRGAPTPHIDNLALEGLRLLNFNVEPWCVPSRAALMAGRFPLRTIVSGKPYLQKSEITIAELLSDAGYGTAIYGKWHLGNAAGLLPTDQGFDEWYGIPDTSNTAEWDTNVQYDASLAPMQRIVQSEKGGRPKDVKTYDISARRTLELGGATRSYEPCDDRLRVIESRNSRGDKNGRRRLCERRHSCLLIAPGVVRTRLSEQFASTQGGEEQITKMLAMGEWVPPEEIAKTIVFLATGRARHLSGATLDINGASYIR